MWLQKSDPRVKDGMHLTYRDLPSSLVPYGYLDRLTDVSPAGKIPGIGEVLALLRLDLLDRALVPLEEKAGAIFPVDQRQTSSIRAQARVVLNEMILFHPEVRGDSRNLLLSDSNESGPATTGRTALAEIGGRHGRKG